MSGDDKKVVLVKNGKRNTFAAEDAAYWVEHGWHPETTHEKRGAQTHSEQKRRYKGKAEAFRAAGEGAIDTLSAGTAGYLGLLGDETGDRAIAHPGARTAGEFVGLGLGLLAGGSSGLAKAVGVTPLGALTRGSAALGNKLGGGMLGLAAEGVTEGAIFGAGQVLMNSTITNKPIAGEDLAGGVIAGGLTGAVTGLAAGGLLKLSRASAKKVQSLFDTSSAEGKQVISEIDSQIGMVDDSVAEHVERIARYERAKKKSLDLYDEADFAGEFTGKKAAEPGPTNPSTAAGKGQGGKFDNLDDRVQSVDLDELQSIKRRGAPADGPTTKAMPGRKGRGLDEGSGAEPAEVVSSVEAQFAKSKKIVDEYNMMRKAVGTDITGANLAKQIADPSIPDLDKAKMLGRYAKFLDDAKKLSPDIAEAVAEQGKSITAALNEALVSKVGAEEAATIMDKVMGGVEALEVADLIGEAAGYDINPLPANIEPFFHLMMISRMGYRAKSGKPGMISALLGSSGSRTGAQALGDMGKGIGAPRVGEAGLRGVGAFFGAKYARGAGKALEADGAKVFARQARAEGRISRALNGWSAMTKKAAPITIKIEDIMTDLFEPSALDPDEGALKRASKGTPHIDPNLKQFMRKHKQLVKLMGNPAGLEARVDQSLEGLRLLDPELAEMTKKNIMETMAYLHDKLPKNYGLMKSIGGDSWKPSSGAVYEFNLHARAALDPASVVEDLVSGRLTPQAAEAFKTLHPAHFAKVQTHLMSNPEKLQKLTYEQKILLGYLFDVPTDPMLVAGAGLQMNFNTVEEQNQAQTQAKGASQKPPTPSDLTKAQKLTDR